MRIASDLLDTLRGLAAGSEDEICGLLLGREGAVETLAPCRNVAADRRRRFEIDPAALIAGHRAARAGGPAIVGCYHSHPSGRAEPSAQDAADAESTGWLWLIVADGEVRAWRAVDGGRVHGRFEPVAIDADGAT